MTTLETSEPQLLYEARPRGYPPPSRGELLLYLLWLGLIPLGVAVWWGIAAKFGSPSLSWAGQSVVLSSVGFSATLPNPISWVVLLAMLELYRVAYARSLVLTVTRGAIELRRGVFWSRSRTYPRTGREELSGERRGLRLRGDDLDVRLPGFDDVEGLRAALSVPVVPGLTRAGSRFELDRRRALLLALALVAAGVAAVSHHARGPITADVRWLARSSAIEVELDAPRFGARELFLDLPTLTVRGGGGAAPFTGFTASFDASLRRRCRYRLPVPAGATAVTVDVIAFVHDEATDPRAVDATGHELKVSLTPGATWRETLVPDVEGWLHTVD